MSRIEDNGKLLATNFGELGLLVEFVKGTESPLGDTFFFNLKAISDYNEKYIKDLLEKIAVFHHLDMTFSKTKEAHFKVFVQYGSKNAISLIQCMSEVGYREVALGKDSEGNVLTIDFDKTPHLLIGGTTGSGKSVLMHDILCNLYVLYGSNRKTLRFK